jgi:hypothetical protein
LFIAGFRSLGAENCYSKPATLDRHSDHLFTRLCPISCSEPLGGNGQRLFLTFAASSVCASANVRTIADANAANALGMGAVTEGFAGQTTMTFLVARSSPGLRVTLSAGTPRKPNPSDER